MDRGLSGTRRTQYNLGRPDAVCQPALHRSGGGCPLSAASHGPAAGGAHDHSRDGTRCYTQHDDWLLQVAAKDAGRGAGRTEAQQQTGPQWLAPAGGGGFGGPRKRGGAGATVYGAPLSNKGRWQQRPHHRGCAALRRGICQRPDTPPRGPAEQGPRAPTPDIPIPAGGGADRPPNTAARAETHGGRYRSIERRVASGEQRWTHRNISAISRRLFLVCSHGEPLRLWRSGSQGKQNPRPRQAAAAASAQAASRGADAGGGDSFRRRSFT